MPNVDTYVKRIMLDVADVAQRTHSFPEQVKAAAEDFQMRLKRVLVEMTDHAAAHREAIADAMLPSEKELRRKLEAVLEAFDYEDARGEVVELRDGIRKVLEGR